MTGRATKIHEYRKCHIPAEPAPLVLAQLTGAPQLSNSPSIAYHSTYLCPSALQCPLNCVPFSFYMTFSFSSALCCALCSAATVLHSPTTILSAPRVLSLTFIAIPVTVRRRIGTGCCWSPPDPLVVERDLTLHIYNNRISEYLVYGISAFWSDGRVLGCEFPVRNNTRRPQLITENMGRNYGHGGKWETKSGRTFACLIFHMYITSYFLFNRAG